VTIQLRPFEDRDYERLAEISATIDSKTVFTAEMLRYRDAIVEPRVRMLRLVAEMEVAGAVGVGRIMHTWWSYHPRRFQLRIEVEPKWQGRGIGSALYERLVGELRAWDAELIRADTPAAREASVAFLEHRGFREWRRRWESALDVATANVAPLLAAASRASADGIVLRSYADEYARRGARLVRDLYDSEILIFRDEPGMESSAEPMSFERFVATELDTPNALPEAHFLALSADRVVGVSRLVRDLAHPHVLLQAVTGTHPEFRGRGIAQALKLRTIEFARDQGYREIRTANDSTNAPMLHINDAIGFKRESPLIIFERHLAP
jgi:GNAT superfamily N-acetyltransferase